MIVCLHTQATKAQVDAAAIKLVEEVAQAKAAAAQSNEPGTVVTEATEDMLFERVTGKKFICRKCVGHFTDSLQEARKKLAQEEKGAA